MKVVLCLLVCAVAYAVAVPAGKFTTKYDNIDIEAILKNKRLFNAYIKCVLEGSPCTPEGTTLKDAIPEALQNGCDGCSEKQKELVERVAPILINDHRPQWEKLKAKYDPQNKYSQKYADLAAKRGIKA